MPLLPDDEVKSKLGVPGEDDDDRGLPDESTVLARNTAPFNWPVPPWCEYNLPCPMTRTIPFQVASGSNVNVPVTRRSPYPVPCQPLTVKSPLITMVIGLEADMPAGIFD